MNSRVQQTNADAVRPLRASDRHRLIAESLHVGNPANHARDLGLVPGLAHEQQIELNVDEIRPYDHNPRRAQNPKFAEIKESIRVSGIRNPITVTRRPGESRFMVEAGGNTRLLASQQLWAETADTRFRRLSVLYRPWRAESHVLIAHLIENEQRGDMTFWDKANGVTALKTQLETEQQRTLSVRELETALKQAGIAISYPTLSYYRFATGRLRALGTMADDLTGLDVTKIQPRLNQIKCYAQSRASLTEDDLYKEVLEPVFKRHAEANPTTGKFKWDVLCGECEAGLAAYLKEPVLQCRAAIDDLARTSGAASLEAPPVAVKTLNTSDAVKSLNSEAVPAALHRSDAVEISATGPLIAADTHTSSNQRIIEQMQHFARLAGIQHCLREVETAPVGVAIDWRWPTGEGGEPSPLQRRAWWLLALLCGQFEHQMQIDAADDGHVTCSTLVIDTACLCWLFDSQDEAAVAFRQIVALLRETKSAVPVFRLCATCRSQPEAV